MTVQVKQGRLGVVAQTLSSRCWSHTKIDREMRVRLTDALSALQADGFVTRFFRESVALTYAVPKAAVDLTSEKLAGLVEFLDDDVVIWAAGDAAARDMAHERSWGHYEVLAWPVFVADDDLTLDRPSRLGGYVGLCFRPGAKDLDRARFMSTEVRSSARILFQVLQQRARLYQPFARRMAERYWADATASVGATRKRLDLPWDSATRAGACDLSSPERKKLAVETVSLGFDLRKSTFCMENAAEPSRFADWLDQLVQILMRISHEYGGVFDKFTGDGGLVHFLDEACVEVDERPAIEAAVRCAVSMQKAVAIHIERLREFLRFDSDLLGGSIGIDSERAHWSLDHRQNPITVGKGVVGACRLMDKAPAYAVRMTNIAYQRTDRTLRDAFSSIPFASKEYPADMKIRVWEIRNALDLKWKDQVDVEGVCEDVYSQDSPVRRGLSLKRRTRDTR